MQGVSEKQSSVDTEGSDTQVHFLVLSYLPAWMFSMKFSPS